MILKIAAIKLVMESEKNNPNHIFSMIYKLMAHIEERHEKYPELFLTKNGIKVQHCVHIIYELAKIGACEPWTRGIYYSIYGSATALMEVLVNPRYVMAD
jgi:hypothetical protein